MKTQNLLVGGGILLALVMSFMALNKQTPVVSQIEKPFGAVPTLDGVDFPNTSINGVRESYVSQGMTATSSTICSLAPQLYGTTTVLMFGATFTSGILGANNVSLSTSTNTYATSAIPFILDHVVATNAQDFIVWLPNGTTTASARILNSISSTGDSNIFLKPGERLNLRLATTTGAGALSSYYGGKCSAVFLKL